MTTDDDLFWWSACRIASAIATRKLSAKKYLAC